MVLSILTCTFCVRWSKCAPNCRTGTTWTSLRSVTTPTSPSSRSGGASSTTTSISSWISTASQGTHAAKGSSSSRRTRPSKRKNCGAACLNSSKLSRKWPGTPRSPCLIFHWRRSGTPLPSSAMTFLPAKSTATGPSYLPAIDLCRRGCLRCNSR